MFKIDLDKPMSERLKDVHAYFYSEAKPIINKILDKVQKFVGGPIQLFLLEQATKLYLNTKAPNYLFDEIHEYAQHSGISPHIVALMNIYYEFGGTACTSSVVRLPNKNIVFGSNLDFSFSRELGKLAY